MIWRLMAMIMLVSDTGSVSVTTTHTDWPTEQQCREIIATHYQTPQPKEFNGHTIAAKVGASCVPIKGGALPPVVASDAPLPPVVAPTWRPRPPAPPPPPGFREFFFR